jgi:hypothetical protein
MGFVRSTYDYIHFVSSLALYAFGQPMLRCILCTHCHGMHLMNASSDTFCVSAGMGVVLLTHVEMHLASSLAEEGFGQHM